MANQTLPQLLSFPQTRRKARLPVPSYSDANKELARAFDRYLEARGLKPATRVTYGKTAWLLIEFLCSRSVAEADRTLLRQFLGTLCSRGLNPNTIRRHTAGLRAFFKFVQLTRLTPHDPTLMLSHRKLPGRVQRVLTRAEIDLLMAAAKTPVELAVVEWLYATGVRVSELVSMRLEDMNFAAGVARVKKGKGGKDRIVLFGSKADAAIRRMIEARPPQKGFLFETPARYGYVRKHYESWEGRYYDGGRIQQYVRIGPLADFPTREDARREFDRILAVCPGYRPNPPRQFTSRAIHMMVARMGKRAGIGRVHPHALRRAMATHMLENGADLRAIQDLLGHERVSTTAIYTTLSIKNLKVIHMRCHPKGEDNGQA
jgi:site-specific recombinase XerD